MLFIFKSLVASTKLRYSYDMKGVVTFLCCCLSCSNAAVISAIKKFVATSATFASLTLGGPLSSFATTSTPTPTTYSYTPIGNLATAVKAIQDNPESLSCSLDTQQADENHGSCQLLDNVVRWRAGKVLTIKQVCCPLSLFLVDLIVHFIIILFISTHNG